MQTPKYPPLSPEELKKAIAVESEEFEKAYRWLEQHMPPSFLDETDPETRILIARNVLSFSQQDRFTPIHFKHKLIVLCTDAPDADLKVLKHYSHYVIRYYRSFVSNNPPPGQKEGNLRISALYFRESSKEEKLQDEQKRELFALLQAKNPEIKEAEFEAIFQGLSSRFTRSMTKERLALALEVFFRAKTRNQCQYEIRKNEDWLERDAPSLQLVMAWRNIPKAGFLYRLAKIINSHHLALQKMVATYIQPFSTESIQLLSLGLHGIGGKAAWEEADIEDFLMELALLKYDETEDLVSATFVEKGLLSGNEGHLVRNFINFVHQVLVYADPNFYSFEQCQEALCRHPELTVRLCKLFQAKFHPDKLDLVRFKEEQTLFTQLVDRLDTGQALNDLRRKNILKQTLSFIDHTLKTNFYRHNKSAFSFRLDPKYLESVPYERREKFPELPFAIFFIRSKHFLGFNIRFKDLARGGVRTVIPERQESFYQDRNTIFSEGYQLAFTQQKKNKDIPEGGAKTILLLEPFDILIHDEEIYKQEMIDDGLQPALIEEKLKIYRQDHKLAYLYSSQRAFIDSFMTLINCDEEGYLRAHNVVDYYKRPEYIYLGPDENMFNDMITWIADYAIRCNYKPGRSFMSGKPGAGINHKEFGVTSYGVNVYLHEILHSIGIDPEKESFTIKISGGPDGDVAGNEILNLHKFYPKIAKLLALTDVSGTIYDPIGLDLKEMAELFHQSLPIRSYPAQKLSEGGFLLDLKTKKELSAYEQQTLLLRKKEGKLVEEWLSGNEMHQLYRNNLHRVKADVFIPGGGRPRTLNENNYTSFLDETGKPTSKAIVEGANLYLTPGARKSLEKLGTLIIKDSSCNKGGVICSSFEVLASLCMSEEKFLKEKSIYVKEVLEVIRVAALNEARLLLHTHKKTGEYLTDISERISEKINLFKYQLLDHLEAGELPIDQNDPLIRCLFLYCPPLLRKNFREGILSMPSIHKKAIISCFLASHLVYSRGLDWSPSIVDVLNSIAGEFLEGA